MSDWRWKVECESVERRMEGSWKVVVVGRRSHGASQRRVVMQSDALGLALRDLGVLSSQ